MTLPDAGPRYAIYFVPAETSDLYRFGSHILGYDCYSGRHLPETPLDGFDETERELLSREPRRYGFHATLKAPFRLRAEADQESLLREFASFAAAQRPLPPIRIGIELLGNFAALLPEEPSAALGGLAEDCVRNFDRFRAPLTQQERTRRLAGNLSTRQAANLDRYGYPYVFDDFRFHMTLSGPLANTETDLTLQALREKFAEAVPDPTVMIEAISLLRQDSPESNFRVVHQSSLGAERAALAGA